MKPWTHISRADLNTAPVVLACLPAGAFRNHYRKIWPNGDSQLTIFELPPTRAFNADGTALLSLIGESVGSFCSGGNAVTIFGHSLGSSVALALAHLLEKNHQIDATVALSSVPMPQEGYVDPRVAAGFIEESMRTFLPDDVKLPDSMAQMLRRVVADDFMALPWLSKLGINAVDKVEGFIVGDDDPLCREVDIRWWMDAAPSALFTIFQGGHFGYMDEAIAAKYRIFIRTVAYRQGQGVKNL